MSTKNKFITYEEFGAKGDGVADDMPAIVACHAYANEHGLSVTARDDAEYYIGGKALTAEIMTDTHWGSAKFTIDDRNLENIRSHCFRVASKADRFTPDIRSLQKNQKRIDFPHEGTVYVRVFSSNRKVYIRKGLNRNNGSDASDCFIVDPEGKILNGINWDYETVTEAYAFSIDDSPIVIDGGIFTTIANVWESKYDYHSRNIEIERSNVTVRNLTHYVVGETDHGAPYRGFLTTKECCNITLQNCLLTPHRTYDTESQIPGKMVGMGSYDLSFYAAIGVRISHIRQTRDITDKVYWGLMGSNFCKELHLDHCEISRFDAHCGVTNGSIRNCKLGHMGVNLIGFGEFLIENTEIVCDHFLAFRSDYGSFFHGKLTLRNCIWTPTYTGEQTLYVFRAKNTGDHDFGYDCGLPEAIVIDGLTVRDEELKADHLSYVVFFDYDQNFAPGKPYPYGTPKQVTVSIASNAGRPIALCEKPEEYPGLNETVIG